MCIRDRTSTGQPLERIERDTERDFFMSPDEASQYGLIDEIILPQAGVDTE